MKNINCLLTAVLVAVFGLDSRALEYTDAEWANIPKITSSTYEIEGTYGIDSNVSISHQLKVKGEAVVVFRGADANLTVTAGSSSQAAILLTSGNRLILRRADDKGHTVTATGQRGDDGTSGGKGVGGSKDLIVKYTSGKNNYYCFPGGAGGNGGGGGGSGIGTNGGLGGNGFGGCGGDRNETGSGGTYAVADEGSVVEPTPGTGEYVGKTAAKESSPKVVFQHPSDVEAHGGDGFVLAIGTTFPSWIVPPKSDGGYTFAGYFTAASGGRQVFDSAGKLIPGVNLSRKPEKLYSHWGTGKLSIDDVLVADGKSGTGWTYDSVNFVVTLSGKSGVYRITGDSTPCAVRIKANVGVQIELSQVALSSVRGAPIELSGASEIGVADSCQIVSAKAGCPAIRVADGGSLRLYDSSAGGILSATGASGAPAIGCCGTAGEKIAVTVDGDLVLNATGGSRAAGVGLGSGADLSKLVLTFGGNARVTAESGSSSAYDIGAGENASSRVTVQVFLKDRCSVKAKRLGGGRTSESCVTFSSRQCAVEAFEIVPTPRDANGDRLYRADLTFDYDAASSKILGQSLGVTMLPEQKRIEGILTYWLPNGGCRIDVTAQDTGVTKGFGVGVSHGTVKTYDGDSLTVNGSYYAYSLDCRIEDGAIVLDSTNEVFALSGMTKLPIRVLHAQGVELDDVALCPTNANQAAMTLLDCGYLGFRNINMMFGNGRPGISLGDVDLTVALLEGADDSSNLSVYGDTGYAGIENGLRQATGGYSPALTFTDGRLVVRGGRAGTDPDIGWCLSKAVNVPLALTVKGGILDASSLAVSSLDILGGQVDATNVVGTAKNALGQTLKCVSLTGLSGETATVTGLDGAGDGLTLEVSDRGELNLWTTTGAKTFSVNGEEQTKFVGNDGVIDDPVMLCDSAAPTYSTQDAAQAAVAKAVVDRPAAAANVDAGDYASLFSVKAVEIASGASGDSGASGATWTLQAELRDEVKAEVQQAVDADETQASLAESLAGDVPSATVATKAGLYYGLVGATSLEGLDEAAANLTTENMTLGDGTEQTVTGEKPGTECGFYRLVVKP